MAKGAKRAGNLLLALATLLFAMVAAEAVLRRVRPPYWLYPLDPPEDALMIEDPLLGYSLHPGKVEQWTRQHWSVHVAISAEGLRDEPLAAARRAELRVLSVGDSFTFGIGVEQRDTWSEVLETLFEAKTGEPVAVVNAGVPGFNATQIRMQAERLLPRIEPSWVVCALYARSFWRMQNPYAVFGGALVSSREIQQLAVGPGNQLLVSQFRPGRVQDLDFWLKSHFHLAARALDRLVPILRPDLVRAAPWGGIPTPVPKEAYRPVLDEILALRETLSRHGIGLVVLMVNQQESDGSFASIEYDCNRIVVEFADRHGILLVDPLPRFADVSGGEPVLRYPDDMHWTPLAHRVVAQELLDLIYLQGVKPRPNAPARSEF